MMQNASKRLFANEILARSYFVLLFVHKHDDGVDVAAAAVRLLGHLALDEVFESREAADVVSIGNASGNRRVHGRQLS